MVQLPARAQKYFFFFLFRGLVFPSALILLKRRSITTIKEIDLLQENISLRFFLKKNWKAKYRLGLPSTVRYGHRVINLRMQKRAACIILAAQRTSRTVTLFNKLNWIPFYNEAYINRCALAYKRINGTLPDYMNTSLKKNSDVHSRNTRNCNLNLLCPPHRNTSDGGRTFSLRTIKNC